MNPPKNPPGGEKEKKSSGKRKEKKRKGKGTGCVCKCGRTCRGSFCGRSQNGSYRFGIKRKIERRLKSEEKKISRKK